MRNDDDIDMDIGINGIDTDNDVDDGQQVLERGGIL